MSTGCGPFSAPPPRPCCAATIIRGFPLVGSPIYAADPGDPSRSKRSRGYIPGLGGGFEIGIAEGDCDILAHRLRLQRDRWSLPPDDDRLMQSELLNAVSAGLPTICGLSINRDRLSRLFESNESTPARE
jgi:hypothetical protein